MEERVGELDEAATSLRMSLRIARSALESLSDQEKSPVLVAALERVVGATQTFATLERDAAALLGSLKGTATRRVMDSGDIPDEIAMAAYREHLELGAAPRRKQSVVTVANAGKAVTGMARRASHAVIGGLLQRAPLPPMTATTRQTFRRSVDAGPPDEESDETPPLPGSRMPSALFKRRSWHRSKPPSPREADEEATHVIGSKEAFNEMLHGSDPTVSPVHKPRLMLVLDVVLSLGARVYVMVMTPIYLSFRFPAKLPLLLSVANVSVEMVCALEFLRKKRRTDESAPLFPQLFESRRNEKPKRCKIVASAVASIIFSGAPIWTVQVIVGHTNVSLRRFFRVAHVIKFVSIAQTIYSALHTRSVFRETANRGTTELPFDPILYRIAKLMGFFVFMLHYLGCGYHFVGRMTKDRQNDGTGENRIDWAFYATHGKQQPVVQRWAQAYYWATMAVLGNYMKPLTVAQTSFSTCSVLLGMFTTATITGSVTSLLANADVVAGQQRQKRSRIRHYLRVNKVPEALSTKIHAYYDYLWGSTTLPSADDDLFKDLSDTLKIKLSLAVKRKWILSCPLFRDLDPASMVSLCSRLVPKICEPDQVLMAEGEHGTTMFFVIRGTLAVSTLDARSRTRIQVAVLRAGDHFGETAIVTQGGKRTATIRAVTFCELYMLTKSAFIDASKNNMSFSTAIKSAVRKHDISRQLSQKLRRARIKLLGVTGFQDATRRKKKKPPSMRRRYQSFGRLTTTPHPYSLRSRPSRVSSAFLRSVSPYDDEPLNE